MISEYLSETELYYSNDLNPGIAKISDDEFKHLTRVMRHTVNDEIRVTDGKGSIFRGSIKIITKTYAEIHIIESIRYPNELSGITLCIPFLRNNDRLEFALEKCTELGVTNFIIFHSERTLARTPKIDRWNKIVLAAMKQSLRSYLPSIKSASLKEISEISGIKILLDQKAEKMFNRNVITPSDDVYMIIGPEGGFSTEEIKMFTSILLYKLVPNRLRSETAAIICASRLI